MKFPQQFNYQRFHNFFNTFNKIETISAKVFLQPPLFLSFDIYSLTQPQIYTLATTFIVATTLYMFPNIGVLSQTWLNGIKSSIRSKLTCCFGSEDPIPPPTPAPTTCERVPPMASFPLDESESMEKDAILREIVEERRQQKELDEEIKQKIKFNPLTREMNEEAIERAIRLNRHLNIYKGGNGKQTIERSSKQNIREYIERNKGQGEFNCEFMKNFNLQEY